MEITIGVWVIPLLLTIGFIAFGVSWTRRNTKHGSYFPDCTTPFVGMGGTIIAVLLIWLVYFAAMHLFG